MADDRTGGSGERADDSTPPEAVAGGSQWHPLTTAAVIGGALAATAGAYIGTRALARRNCGKDGKVSSVMAAAITATDLRQKKGGEPSAAEIKIDRPKK
ncbi:MAG TPA: hypothetical protein VF662_01725 [Allosphingosinicella sp.]|jgi:hypothetical protein